MKQKIKLKPDKLMSGLAFVISLATLYVFFYQTSLIKKQQYTSVLPYFEIGNTQLGGDYSFILENNGIGPGFINEIKIHYKDSVYKGYDINDFYTEVILKQDTILNSQSISHSSIRKGMLITEKETRYLLRLKQDAENFDQKHLRLRDWLNKRIKIEITYSSIYDEQWKIIFPETLSPIKLN
ncbi:hypothetical protein ACFS5M_12030 [Lacinutrix iliipiscaria]|uniref:FixH protein n=1 Tax=Lacinutrix iliipiscaria TaxID=1230532 RepID=A0ABW5WQ67_9FLAO